MKSKSRCLLALIVFSQAALGATVEKANNLDPLSTDTSWAGSTAPTAADIASFDATYATTGTLTAGALIDWMGVVVGNPGGNVVVNNVAGNEIILGASGVDLSIAADDLAIQNTGISSNQTWNIGAGRTFTIGGAAAVRTGKLTMFDISSAAITKSGPGTVVLDMANASPGAIDWNVTGGAIRTIWSGSSAFGTGTITLGGGGVVTGTPYTGSVGNWTWPNAISLTAATDSFVDNQNIAGTDRTLGLSGAITGDGSLTFRNTGADTGFSYNLSGTNAYTGGTTINGGTVVFTTAASLPATGAIIVNNNGAVGGAAHATVQEWLDSGKISTASTGAIAISAASANAIDFSAGGYNSLALGATGGFTYSGTITPGTGGYIFGGGKTLTVASELSLPTTLTKVGPGTTILSRDANGYSGGTIVNGGELQASTAIAAGARTTFGSGPITVNAGGTLRFMTGSTLNARSYDNAISLNDGTLISDDGVVTYNGAIAVSGASTINVRYDNKNAVLAKTITGSGSVTKTGGGALVLNASGNQLAALTVNQGKISVGSDASLTVDGQYRSSATSAKGSLDIAAGGVVNVDSIFSSWGTNMVINGTLNVTNALTFSGGASTVTGAGTINTTTLAHTNYGTDNINGARINIGTGGITFNQPGALNLGDTTLGATADWSTSAPMALTATTTVRTADPANDTTPHSVTMTGALTGAGGLTKTTAGTLTLTAANGYTGATLVSGGTLALIGGSQSSDITVESGAALGLDPVAPSTSTAALTFNSGSQVTIVGTPAAGTLITAASITGTPVLSPAIAGYTLEVQGNTLVLISAGGDDFTNWINGYTFAGGADKTATGDPDGDGLSNFEEYAFGLAPNSGASVNPIVQTLSKTSGLFQYTRRNPSVTGIVYTYQYSTDLAGWTLFTPDSATADAGNPVQTVTVDVPDTLIANPKLFVRVLAK